MAEKGREKETFSIDLFGSYVGIFNTVGKGHLYGEKRSQPFVYTSMSLVFMILRSYPLKITLTRWHFEVNWLF